MRRNLVIVAAGDNSMHIEWLDAERSYDLWVIYYGKEKIRLSEFRETSDLLFEGSGLKIQLARNFILDRIFFRGEIDLARYQHIWFPDDDLRFPDGPAGLERLFDAAGMLNADVFQPAIQNENYSKMWEPTRQIPGVFCHRTNIVEVMAHGFSGEAFTRAYLPAIHAMGFMKSGWGLEPIWMKIGEAHFKRPLRTFVIDCCPIIHARPVGTGDAFVHNQGRWESLQLPQLEMNRIIKTLEVFSSLDEVIARAANFNTLEGVPDFTPLKAHVLNSGNNSALMKTPMWKAVYRALRHCLSCLISPSDK